MLEEKVLEGFFPLLETVFFDSAKARKIVLTQRAS
jgi:hypothetical protein